MDWLIILLPVPVGFAAGIIRGFAGFGGPAFILAVLTWFMTPIQVIDQVLVVELIVGVYLAWGVRKEIDWPATVALTLPALVGIPLGHWMLLNTDAELMSRAISAFILLAAILMLCNIRFKSRYSLPVLMLVGLVGGFIIGASYIALVLVSILLMTPFDRNETRTLLMISGFVFALWYALWSVYRDQTTAESVVQAIPLAVAYLGGSWLGARLFVNSTEKSYRQYALYLLAFLAVVGLMK